MENLCERKTNWDLVRRGFIQNHYCKGEKGTTEIVGDAHLRNLKASQNQTGKGKGGTRIDKQTVWGEIWQGKGMTGGN